MGFDRTRAKRAARESMRNTRPSPILAALVHIAIVMAVTGLADLLVRDPFQDALTFLQWGYTPEEVAQYLLNSVRPDTLGPFGAVTLLLYAFQLLMGFGFTAYALEMARNRQPAIGRIFDGFPRLFRVLWKGFLAELYTDLRSILFLLPAFLAAGGALVFSGVRDQETIASVCVFLAMVFLGVRVAVSYRYRLSDYFLLDDPACTARQSLLRSKEAMMGWKMELFLLDMSFLGWTVLLVLSGGVAGVWINPYMEGTYANFYDQVCPPEEDQEREGYGIYDTEPVQPPMPF